MAYYPDRVALGRAQRWLQELESAVPWRRLQRPMYERVVRVPRLIANYALCDPARPACLDAMLEVVCGAAPAPYTHAGLNLYRDGQDSVAMHGDRESELAPGQPIAILSLGAPRTMLVRAGSSGPSRRIVLQPGSVLVMSHASQRTHEHGIPKCARTAGARISVAFRVRRPPESQAAEVLAASSFSR